MRRIKSTLFHRSRNYKCKSFQITFSHRRWNFSLSLGQRQTQNRPNKLTARGNESKSTGILSLNGAIFHPLFKDIRGGEERTAREGRDIINLKDLGVLFGSIVLRIVNAVFGSIFSPILLSKVNNHLSGERVHKNILLRSLWSGFLTVAALRQMKANTFCSLFLLPIFASPKHLKVPSSGVRRNQFLISKLQRSRRHKCSIIGEAFDYIYFMQMRCLIRQRPPKQSVRE